jgi:hypothetical protein
MNVSSSVRRSGKLGRRVGALQALGAIHGIFLTAAIMAFGFAARAQAEDSAPTANQLRYQFDQDLHITYWSPEAFGCQKPSVQEAIERTRAEINRVVNAYYGYFREAPPGKAVSPTADALRGIIDHLKDIIARLERLPPCPPNTPDAGGHLPPEQPDLNVEVVPDENGGQDQNGGGEGPGGGQNQNGGQGDNGGGQDGNGGGPGENGNGDGGTNPGQGGGCLYGGQFYCGSMQSNNHEGSNGNGHSKGH